MPQELVITAIIAEQKAAVSTGRIGFSLVVYVI